MGATEDREGRILAALGFKPEDMVRGIILSMGYGEPMSLVVERLVRDEEVGGVAAVIEEYTLEPRVDDGGR